jgi:UPF0042 nucleotide-binding protein
MPVALLPNFLRLTSESSADFAGYAFVMDLRERGFLDKYQPVIQDLKREGYQFDILYLEANEKTLMRRYSQTRRHHPLARDGSLVSAIRSEQERLDGLRKKADRVIDTSSLNVHQLKSIVFDIVKKSARLTPIRIHILSFGFKFGIPYEADLIIDVRFLPNPYFIPELKRLDGRAGKVADHVLNNATTRTFLEKYIDLLDYLIPLYEKEGKAYLTLAVGCTGGRHRSVAIAEALFGHINKSEARVDISHRDINQDT